MVPIVLSYLKKKVLADTEKRLVSAFGKVDSDISHLRSWVSHIHGQQADLLHAHASHVSLSRKDIDNVTRWLQYLDAHNKDVRLHVLELTRTMGEFVKQHGRIHDRVALLEKNLTLLSKKTLSDGGALSGSLRSGSSVRTEPRTEPRTGLKRLPAFEERIVARARTNRKQYTQALILELAAEKKHTTVEVEKLIVEEKRLCGRTTFYAYLRELRAKDLIGDVRVGSMTVLGRVR
ncbi:MAG: hypothetical protein GXP63_00760 [DPANN group archaeon]|nr:hypothetical protein [DPANN group archaeon]